MKHKIRKWILRLTATGIVVVVLLVGIVLDPGLLYASKTVVGNYTIYHNSVLDKEFKTQLDKATELLKESELYDPHFKLEICLNDGSYYPALIEKLRGPAFAWGFYHQVVLRGHLNSKEGFAELNGYRWNLSQLLAHEATHCLQFNRFGIWKFNPIMHYPTWKLEGYPEYVARQGDAQNDLSANIAHLLQVGKTENNGWIEFGDGTGTVIPYYKLRLLVQYCMDIRKMSYPELLNDKTDGPAITADMMNWYANQK